MKSSIIKSALITIALLLSSSPSFATESKAQKADAATANTKSAKPKQNQPSAEIKLVDINSATKAELKKLPGIGDAEAEKIIADRPFLTKAHLQTHNIVTPLVYQGLRQLVIARQKGTPAAKPVKK